MLVDNGLRAAACWRCGTQEPMVWIQFKLSHAKVSSPLPLDLQLAASRSATKDPAPGRPWALVRATLTCPALLGGAA